jgi:heavy metal sensor kinase
MLTLDDAAGGYRVHVRPAPLDGPPMRLIAAYPLHDTEAALDRIRHAFAVVVPLLLVVASAGGYFLARRSLSPVAAMAERASAIGASTLHERLPVPVQDDELGGLARVINDLLDRLERAFAQQRRFMADASHELRTPTAILRTEADVTLSRDARPEAEYRASVGVMRDAARRLTRIVDDLFLLARADAGHQVVRADDMHVEDVVDDAVRAMRPLADQRGVRLALQGVVEAPMRGDADLIGRLVLNLLDNAVKYSPIGGVVSVELAATDAGWTITITDAGPGIPADAHERVFERFFRVDVARSRVEQSATSGAGLGLAIARRIAEAHGGTLVLAASSPGCTVFCATLPAGAASGA